MANSDNKINIGDTWKSLDSMHINIGDTWKDVDEAYVNVGDSWKQFFTSTPPNIIGEQVYNYGTGTYSWVCPVGVTSVSVVCVGGGASACGYYGQGGAGGGLAYKNNIEVTPGQSYTVVVGFGGQQNTKSANVSGVSGGPSSFSNGVISTIATGGINTAASVSCVPLTTGGYPDGNYDGGGIGGDSGCYSNGTISGTSQYGSGGGGAGGYSGDGGDGGGSTGTSNGTYSQATSGTGGAGGGGNGNPVNNNTSDWCDAGGGGTGLYGIGANGNAGTFSIVYHQFTANGGRGGSGGENGIDSSSPTISGDGGFPGGGGGSNHGNNSLASVGNGADGAVRIIWGEGRSFPYNAHDVISDGLITYIDPDNSYPGTGNTLYDLTQNNNDAVFTTLSLNDTFIDFNNSSTCTIPITPISHSNWTLIYACKPTANPVANYRAYISLSETGGSYFMNADTRQSITPYLLHYIKDYILQEWWSEILLSQTDYQTHPWHVYSVSLDNLLIKNYVDGVLISEETITKDISGYGDLNQILLNVLGSGVINMGKIMLYNRTLSSSEVSQNFDSIRGRYNL